MSTCSNQVQVFARIRPTACFAQDLIEYVPDEQMLNVRYKLHYRKACVKNQIGIWSFKLNGLLHNVSQDEVYRVVAHKALLGALDGYNGTVLCYGQTGSGKTFTMTGATESYKERGIIPRALQEVFQEIEHRKSQTFTLYVSYLEIYNETLTDLLTSSKRCQFGQDGALAIVEEMGDGVSVKGLSLHPVRNKEEALELLFMGERNRLIGEHSLNKRSSKSHCIFTIHIKSLSCILSNAKYITSKLNLVDLAGSEKLHHTVSVGQVQHEVMSINKSLSFLEHTILALTKRHRDHVSFRQCKLTYALKDSLGGNCSTVLVANISGEAVHIEETLSTLCFVARIRGLRTKPTIKEHIDPVLQIQILQKEIRHLKRELSIQDTLANRTGVEYGELSEAQKLMIKRQVERYLAGNLKEIDIVNIRQIQEVFVQFKKALQQRLMKMKEQMQVSTPRYEQEAVKPPAPSFQQLKTKLRHTVASQIEGKESEAGADFTSRVKKKGLDAKGTDKARQRLDTPPSQSVAFEDFKIENGSKLNHNLISNKAVLMDKQDHMHKLTATINAIKQEIDRLNAELLLCQSQRGGEGLPLDEKTVLEEMELELIHRLREAKHQYRHIYEEMHNIRDEICQYQRTVDKCREQLLTDFEKWYNESFLLPEEALSIFGKGPIKAGAIPVEKVLSLEQHEILEHDEAFYNTHSKLLEREKQAHKGIHKYKT